MKTFTPVVQSGTFIELGDLKITTEKIVQGTQPCIGCVFTPGTIGCNTHQCGLDVRWISQQTYIDKYITARLTK